MSLNLISKSESQIPFFIKNHITPFLSSQDEEALSQVSFHFYLNYLAKSPENLLSKTIYPLDKEGMMRPRQIKGLQIGECSCVREMGRLEGEIDWRGMFEKQVLSQIEKHFPTQKTVSLGFLACGTGLQVALILQQLKRIKKTAHTILLADPLLFPKEQAAWFFKDLSSLIHAISPATKIVTRKSVEEVIQSGATQQIDVFLTFDSEYLTSPEVLQTLEKNSKKKTPAVKSLGERVREMVRELSEVEDRAMWGFYLPQFYKLQNALREAGGTKLFLAGERDHKLDIPETSRFSMLHTRVFLKTPTDQMESLYWDDSPVKPPEFLIESVKRGYWPTAIQLLRNCPYTQEQRRSAFEVLNSRYSNSHPGYLELRAALTAE